MGKTSFLRGLRGIKWDYARTDGHDSLGLQQLRRETNKINFIYFHNLSLLWNNDRLIKIVQNIANLPMCMYYLD